MPFLIIFLAMMSLVCAQYNHGYQFTHRVLGEIYPTRKTFRSGQEIRVRLTTEYGADVIDTATATTIRSGLNISFGATRVRIINAYPSRALTGTKFVRCNATTESDVWAEFWSLSTRYYLWGGEMATVGLATFTVPPFPFRTCVKTVSDSVRRSKGWKNQNLETLYCFTNMASLRQKS